MGINHSIQHPTECIANSAEQKEAIRSMQASMNSSEWIIDFKVYTDGHWKTVLPLIKKTYVNELKCVTVKVPDFIHKIAHIEFASLRTLHLHYNFILSIEGLPRLNAPQLQNLQITSNRIVSIRPLRKLYAPRLKNLTFIENQIREADCLTEINCNAEFEQLLMFCAQNKALPESYNWMFKMKPTVMRSFEYYDTKVIRNSKTREMLRQRYPNISITLRYDAVQ